MEFLISAPGAFLAGVGFYLSLEVFAREMPALRAMLGSDGRLAFAWSFAVMVALQGLWFFAARVVGLQLAGALDVVRVGFGFSLWLVFSVGIGITAYWRRREING